MSWTQGGNFDSDRAGFKVGVEDHVDNTMQPYALDQEAHVVMTVDDDGGPAGQTQIRVYKDGVLRGTLNTDYDLSQLVDDNNFLGRSQYGDNTANASYNELRIYSQALKRNQVANNSLNGPDGAVQLIPDLGQSAEWNFRYHDAGGNTQGPEVGDGENVAAGDLFSSAVSTPPEDSGTNGHRLRDTPVYRRYDLDAEGLRGMPGADGFAMDTTTGYPYWSDSGSPLQQALATNDTFSVWARAKRTADAPGGGAPEDDFEAILSRPYRWRIGVDGDGTIAATFGDPGTSGAVDFDTGIPFDLGEWHEIGFTYDGTGAADGTVTIFVDGEAVGSLTPPAFSTGDVFHIGNGPSSRWDFHGLVDRSLFWEDVVGADVMRLLSTRVPEPSTFALAGLGLIGLVAVGRRKRRKS